MGLQYQLNQLLRHLHFEVVIAFMNPLYNMIYHNASQHSNQDPSAEPSPLVSLHQFLDRLNPAADVHSDHFARPTDSPFTSLVGISPVSLPAVRGFSILSIR